MKMSALPVLLLVLPGCLAAPAKLDHLHPQSGHHNLDSGYQYTTPSVPSGLYDLPSQPSIQSSTRRPTTTTTTTTTTTPPPPPPGLYGTPDFDGGPSNLNPNFVSIPIPLDVPKLELHATPTPATVSTPRGFSPPPPMMDKGSGPYMPYDIAWGVNDPESGNMFSHSESSGGNDVQGEYRVLLPDGRLQVVTFWADAVSGYHAKVTYQ